MKVDLMGRRGHRFFLAGGVVVRCRGIIEEKSPDFRSPEVGNSAYHETASLKFHHLHIQMNSTPVHKCECIDYERQKENYLGNIPGSALGEAKQDTNLAISLRGLLTRHDNNLLPQME